MSSKRSSYPSRQLRSGPAPLASFEDLSDAISSPEDLDAAIQSRVYGDDDERVNDDDGDSAQMYSDGATPSTPRVLAQTPSTPLALDNAFSMGTPDSLDGGRTDTERADSPRPHFVDVIAEEREPTATTTPPPPPPSSVAAKKSGGITPSPRSSRKLFTMSFFKPRTEDRSPSPMKSPKSPRRLSPSAISPKSPRRLSPFGTFFRSGKDHLEVTTTTSSSLGNDLPVIPAGPQPHPLPPPPPPSLSPTKKKGHFPNFLWSKEEPRKNHSSDVSLPATHVKKEGSTRYANVFASLFRKGDVHATASPTASSASDGQTISRTALNDSPDEWSSLRADDTKPPASSTEKDAFEAEREGIGIDDLNMFDSTHNIVEDVEFDLNLRLGISPSADGHSPVAPFPERMKPPVSVPCEEIAPHSDAITAAVDEADRTSPTESEVEAPDDTDPILLKTATKGDEPEAETLLREDSFEAEDFGVGGGSEEMSAIAKEHAALIEKAEQMALTKHRDKMASFRTNPLERPRSTAPVSFSSLEAYISIVSTRRQTSPTLDVKADSDFVSDAEKLKVILPGEEFEHKERQTKKSGVYKSWLEFCEVGLQSPRSRRRQMAAAAGTERASSAPSATRASSVSVSERCKLADVGFSASDDWVTFDSSSLFGSGVSTDDETDTSKPTKYISKSLPRPPKPCSATMTMSPSSASSDSYPSQPDLRRCDDRRHSSNGGGSSSSGGSSSRSSPTTFLDVTADPLPTMQEQQEQQSINTTSPPEYFMPSNGDFSKDWTLRTTFSSDDIHLSSVPDCVASISLRQERGDDREDLSQSPVNDFFNGGIDLLASIPAISKCPAALPAANSTSTVASSSFRRAPPPPPRAPTADSSSSLTSHQHI